MQESRICLATATTEDFLPGTVVTVASFLKAHPDFDGDVVIIHDGLAEEHREVLSALSGRVRVRAAPRLRPLVRRAWTDCFSAAHLRTARRLDRAAQGAAG